MAAQDLDADGMERAHPRHAFDLLAQHPANPIFHFPRGLVGEGYRQNFVGPRPAHGHKVHDTGGQSLGFARASPCQHQHRAIHRLYRRTLCRVQAVHVGRRPCCHCTLRQRHGGVKGICFIETVHAITIARFAPMLKKCSMIVPQVFRCQPYCETDRQRKNVAHRCAASILGLALHCGVSKVMTPALAFRGRYPWPNSARS